MKNFKSVICFMVTIFCLCGCSEKETLSDSEKIAVRDIFAMDTYMNLKAYGENADYGLGLSANKIIELENTLSVTNEESDISKINNSKGEYVSVNDDVIEIITFANEISRKTNGALDITVYPLLKEWGFTTDNYKVPDKNTISELIEYVNYQNINIDKNNVSLPVNYQIDTGAVAKGYTGDKVMEILKNQGITSAIINLGGNVQTLGSKPDGSEWKVAVKNPFLPNEEMCIVSIEDKAVITSGIYERYFTGDDGIDYWHILDTQTGYPARNGLVSVTIIGESGIMCDALSTALFVSGTENAIEYWKNNGNFEMILVNNDGKISYTEGLADSFTNISDMTEEMICYE